MTQSIVLVPGATAEPNTCGSCSFFECKDYNEYNAAWGFCRFQFPKKLATQWDIRRLDPAMKDQEYTGNEDQTKDTERCDLYNPDGKSYIVQRRVGP